MSKERFIRLVEKENIEEQLTYTDCDIIRLEVS